MTFADRIKELRKEKGITQVELAEIVGLSKGTVAMWEVGKREANFETLAKLSDYFEKSIDYILGRSDDDSTASYTDEATERIIDVHAEEDVEKCVKEFLKLDYYGMKAVMNLVGIEYKRCVSTDSLTNFYPYYHLTKEE